MRFARWSGIALGVAVAMAGLGQAGAQAADAAPAAQPSVIFLGDSVTAGFGYLGAKENAPHISGPVNSEYANSWYFGDNSLSDCSPPSDGSVPIDQCSNNNYNGRPWDQGPWQAGPNAPNVSYSYQIAANQDPTRAAPIENWAVTGSTPAQWDTGGPFNFQLRQIKNTTVVMTLGANPILAAFLKVRLGGINQTNGVCTDSTMWFSPWSGWWSYTDGVVSNCVNQQWAVEKQHDHLVSIYKQLLTAGNRVMAVQYHRACTWAFGKWQPNGNMTSGPAAGNDCRGQTEKISDCSSCPEYNGGSQWRQAVVAGNELNANLNAAVADAQRWADQNGYSGKLQLVQQDQNRWESHQAWNADSWVFKNDTWIHPSKAGHTEFARVVTTTACQVWGTWCGNPYRWDAGATAPQPTQVQTLPAVPGRIGIEDGWALPSATRQGHPLHWRSRSPRVCKVALARHLTTYNRDITAGGGTSAQDQGTCKLAAFAAASGKHRELHKTVRVQLGKRA